MNIDDAIVDEYAKLIGGNSVMVYLALNRFADNLTHVSCLSIAHIAELLGLCEATTRKALKTLEHSGPISKEERYWGDGSQASNLYTVLPIPHKDERCP